MCRSSGNVWLRLTKGFVRLGVGASLATALLARRWCLVHQHAVRLTAHTL